MSTCNRLESQTVGSQLLIMPNNLPDRWLGVYLSKAISKFQRASELLDERGRVDDEATEGGLNADASEGEGRGGVN